MNKAVLNPNNALDFYGIYHNQILDNILRQSSKWLQNKSINRAKLIELVASEMNTLLNSKKSNEFTEYISKNKVVLNTSGEELERIAFQADSEMHLSFDELVKSQDFRAEIIEDFNTCLLYTSDAADDTPCVDLGGRRII